MLPTGQHVTKQQHCVLIKFDIVIHTPLISLIKSYNLTILLSINFNYKFDSAKLLARSNLESFKSSIISKI